MLFCSLLYYLLKPAFPQMHFGEARRVKLDT